jgi:hypothetical protein
MHDLLGWHKALHEVTGAMALRWCRANAGDLRAWAHELRAIAAAMEAASVEEPASGEAAESAKASDIIPDWLLEATDL